jgi:WD40 repeat protein
MTRTIRLNPSRAAVLAAGLMLPCVAQAQEARSGDQTPKLVISAKTPRNLVMAGQVLDDGRIALEAGGEGESVLIGQTVTATPAFLKLPVGFLEGFAGRSGLFVARTGGDGGLDVRAYTKPDQWLYTADAWPYQSVAISRNGAMVAEQDRRTTPGRTVAVQLSNLYFPASMPNGTAAEKQTTVWNLATDADPKNISSADFFYFFGQNDLLVAVDHYSGTVHRFDTNTHTELPATLLPDPRPVAPQQFQIEIHFVGTTQMNADGTAVAVYQTGFGVRLVRLRDGAIIGATEPKIDPDTMAPLAGGAFLLGMKDGRLMRWNGKGETVELVHLAAGIGHIVPLEAKHLVVAATSDGVNHLLDLDSGVERVTLLLTGKDQWALIAPDGRFDASDFGAKDLGWKINGAILPFEDYADDLTWPGLSDELITGKYETSAIKLQPKERRLPTLTVSAQPTRQGASASVKLVLHAAQGVGIRSPRLKRNGVMVKEWEGTYKDGETLESQVDLVAGADNIFTAYAYNQDNVKSEDAAFTLPDTGEPIRPGDLWVIAVGVNVYKNLNFNLNYAVNDARLAAWSLATQRQAVAANGKQAAEHPMQGYEGKPILNDGKHFIDMRPSMGPVHVRLLLDKDATRKGILDAIRDYSAQARPEDTFVIFFAGHGIAEGKRYYLLPHDMSFPGTPSELSLAAASVLDQSAVSDEDLRKTLSSEQASTAALILDACQSGALTGDNLLERRGPMNSNGLRQLAYDKNMFLLAASLSTQSAAEQASIGDGVLTHVLFQRGLLEDAAATTTGFTGPGPVLLSEWLSWATRNVQLEPGQVLERVRGFRSTASKTPQQSATAGHAAPPGVAIQQPRLFAPPLERPIIVAIGAATLDPLTVAKELPPGTEGATVAPAAEVSAPVLETASGAIELKDFETLGLRPNSLGPLSSGTLRPDGRTMVAIHNGAVAEIDLTNARLQWSHSLPDTARACDMTATGEVACIGASGRVFTGAASTNSTIKEIAQLGGTGGVSLIRSLHDGNLLAVRGQVASVLQRDGKIVKSVDKSTAQFPFPDAVAFDGKSERLFFYGMDFKRMERMLVAVDLPSLAITSSEPMPLAPDSKGIASISVSPGGDWLASLDFDGRVTGKNLRSKATLKLPRELADGPAGGPATAIAFSTPNELLVALLGGTVLHIDPNTGTITAKDKSSAAWIFDIVQDGATGVRAGIGLEGSLAVWRGKDAEAALVVPGGRYMLYLAFAPGGQLQALMKTENTFRLFSLPQPAAVSEAEVSVRGDLKWKSGSILMLGSGARLLRWNPQTLAPLAPVDFGSANHFAENAEVSPDGLWAAWIEEPKLSGNIDVATPTPVAHLKSLVTGAESKLQNTAGVPKQIFFTSDSRSLAVLTMPETNLMLDEAGGVIFVPVGDATTHAIKTYMIPGLPSGIVRFDAKAQTMLAISPMNGEMRLYDLFHGENGKLKRRETLKSMASTAELDVEGKHAVVGMMDGSITWWDPNIDPVTLPALSAAIVSVAFRPDGNGFVVGAMDGSIAWFHTADPGTPVLDAITRWNEEGKAWVTTERNGQLEIAGARDSTTHSANMSDLLLQLVQRGNLAPHSNLVR